MDDDRDDEPPVMSMGERTVWVYLVAVVVTSGAYFARMVPAALSHPVHEIAWVGPMLWTLGLSILGTVVGTVGAAILASLGGIVGLRRLLRPSADGADRADPGGRGGCSPDEPTTDVRDTEISLAGDRASTWVLGVALAAGLVLAMLDADTFWIGNALFLCGTVGALVETGTKLRLYHRGF